MQCILLQIAQRLVQMAVLWNINSFYHIHMLTPFLHQNEPSRESIFCDKVSTWWIKRALMRLNFLPRTGQKNAYAAYQHVSNGTETTYTYYRQREQLAGMLPTANGHSTMETQK